MSKSQVDTILQLAAAGRWEEADRLASTLEPRFLEKRLTRLTATSEAAREVWVRLHADRAGGSGTPVPPPPAPTPRETAVSPSAAGVDEPLPPCDLPQDVVLESPALFLNALQAHPRFCARMDRLHFVQVWGLVALATLARRDSNQPSEIVPAQNDAGKFAHALGVFDVIAGAQHREPGEKGRTVKLRRLQSFSEIEPTAGEISRLILGDPEEEETRRTIYYVLVELLRNVAQHSRDPVGGVVAAQRMDARQRYLRPTIQVAVADAGVGIPAALRGMHPDLQGPEDALEKSLWPHFSGAFEEWRTGTEQNAGMGLFFISEMAKLTAGRLLVASRGAALFLRGDHEDVSGHTISFLQPAGTGFPGTLVAFEMPVGGVQDYEGLIEVISKRAKERTPQRSVQHWIRFVDEAPEGVPSFLVFRTAENTVAAREFATRLLERIFRKEPVALDFRELEICTQSYLHTLMYEPLRLAWARQTPVFVLNAKPGVRSGIALLEQYALGG